MVVTEANLVAAAECGTTLTGGCGGTEAGCTVVCGCATCGGRGGTCEREGVPEGHGVVSAGVVSVIDDRGRAVACVLGDAEGQSHRP